MTIAEQLNAKEFPFYLYDAKGNEIYFEDYDGYWEKREYDANGREIYSENCKGLWVKYRYDSGLNIISSEDSNDQIINHRK